MVRYKGSRFAGGLFLFAALLSAETTIIDCGSATDSNFTGGLTFAVPATGDQTGRYDALKTGMAYTVPVVDGMPYIVTLRFLEPSVQSAGQRVFSVAINNQIVVDKIDLFVEAGFQKPIARSFVAVGSSGALVIRFTTQFRSAVISAIEITPLSDVLPSVTTVPLSSSVSVLRGCAATKIDATSIQISECADGVRLLFGPDPR